MGLVMKRARLYTRLYGVVPICKLNALLKNIKFFFKEQ